MVPIILTSKMMLPCGPGAGVEKGSLLDSVGWRKGSLAQYVSMQQYQNGPISDIVQSIQFETGHSFDHDDSPNALRCQRFPSGYHFAHLKPHITSLGCCIPVLLCKIGIVLTGTSMSIRLVSFPVLCSMASQLRF